MEILIRIYLEIFWGLQQPDKNKSRTDLLNYEESYIVVTEEMETPHAFTPCTANFENYIPQVRYSVGKINQSKNITEIYPIKNIHGLICCKKWKYP